MRAIASQTTAARSRTRPEALLLAAALGCSLLAIVGCRRETDGQTAVLLTLSTEGPVDCVTLEEGQASQGDGGQAFTQTQTLKIGAGLPDAFLKAFKTAKTTALIYSGHDLGGVAVSVQAAGRRGGCGGAVVARYGPATLSFTQGKVSPVDARLALLGVDSDLDGYAAADDCDDHDASIYPGAPELCDGKDHSCSGVLDRGCACSAGSSRACYPLGLDSPTLGVGVCRKGAQACVSGKWDGFCVGAQLPAPEQCDDLDHDCDGQKGLPSCPCKAGDVRRCYTKGPIALAGVGRCSWGQQSCGGDGFFGACQGDVAPLPEELCNGIDDNCNGTIDEELDQGGRPVMVRPACSKTEGVCAGAKKHCAPGSGTFAACTDAEYTQAARAHATFYGPDSPTCDKVDHDCDGTIDTGCASRFCPAAGNTRDCYGPGLGSPALQHKPCKRGTQTCGKVNGQLLWGACAGEVPPVPEVCNGVDDDCNGAVDDLTAGEGVACSSTGKPGVCADGVRRCQGGALPLVCASITEPSPEVCDGLDNDCNGKIDELWNKQTDPAHCGGINECRACPSGDACCAGRCADLKSDSLNCGACGRVCGRGQGCCAGVCKALDTSSNCGVCGIACPGGLSCRAGLCLPPKEVQCADGIDNDGNGLTDCQDPSCQGLSCDGTGGTCNQRVCQHETLCADGLDNDGDGKIDCQDPDCRGKRCAGNGVCTASGSCIVEICSNGIDDNSDGKIDCQDPVSCPPPPGPVGAVEQCCSLKWTDTQQDLANCGACGNDCCTNHTSACGSITCSLGQCKYGAVPDRTSCPSGVCCRGKCVQDAELSCTDGVDDNCDGAADCQDALSCPAPGSLTTPGCCGTAWADLDHGDLANCGACGKRCAPPVSACGMAVCKPGGVCSSVTDCNKPGCDGVSCASSGQAGYCSGGTCCTGCIGTGTTTAGVCLPGDNLGACRSANGLCTDCSSNNTCITDSCTPSGCSHVPNTNPCKAAGQPGVCGNGVCCAGCFDANTGACTPIDAAHCGKAGGTCIGSCSDGNSCTTDACDSTGSTASCTHTPVGGAPACSAGGASGRCGADGLCCTGCLQSGVCVAASATSGAACGIFGADCATCPDPAPPRGIGPECQVAACSAGSCQSFNKPDGTSCNGGGTCHGGTCVTCSGGGACGGACCGPGEQCVGSGSSASCACDTSGTASDCTKNRGCCSQASPSRCLPASFDSCAQCGKVFCSGGGDASGPCVDKTGAGGCIACLLSALTCGGAECLTPGTAGNGNSGHLNLCSTPTNLQACVVGGTTGRCTCVLGDPTSCPGGPSSVCRAPGPGSPACFGCGDAGTDGLPCKGGGTCNQGACT